jgi:hypothetical protein
MRFKKLALLIFAILLVAGIAAFSVTPFAVAGGLRLWAARIARQAALRIEFGKIEAPLFRPVVVHNLRVVSEADARIGVMVEATRVELALNFTTLFSQARGRFLRSLTAEAIKVDITRNLDAAPAPHRAAWPILDELLADNFKLSGLELHVKNGDTIVDLHNGNISGAQIEAGVFSASDITIESSWLRKSFSDLRGATSWQEGRLTIGGLTLARGLDLETVGIDLSHIGESRIALELGMDAFGGKIRARISGDDHADKRTWDAAGTASEISLAQMSDALDLTDRASGSLHACKFTFRGEATNLREATATVWAEVTGLTWRDRTADTIMIGASLYNLRIQIEQFFVKQRNNQLTLTGESALPQKLSDWLNPDFHGDISASINDLGDFARLFGASPPDFAGKIDIFGNVAAHERKLAGQLSVSGNSLKVFRAPVESLDVTIALKESRLEIATFDLRRKSDSFCGQASMDLAGDRSYSVSFTSSIADIADYAELIPEPFQSLKLSGGLNLDWTATGVGTTDLGTFHARAHAIHLLETPVIPFDVEIEGDYSPDNIFFRQFSFSNQHAAFSAFVTLARDYFQLQALRFDLEGKPKLQGDVFAPVSLSKIREQGNWLAALNEDPNFDLDLALNPTDLAELASAVTTQPKMSGQIAGNLEVYGRPALLVGRSSIHLRDFVLGNEPRISADVEGRIGLGTVNGKATLNTRSSGPVNLDLSIPLKLEKRESDYALNTDGSLSGTLNFPTVFLSRLPLYLSRRIFADGILSGRLTISDSLQHPQLRGAAHLINGRYPGGGSLSAGVTFGGRTATIDYAQVVRKNVRHLARGEMDFRDLTDVTIKILPNEPLAALTFLEPDTCIDGIEFLPNGTGGLRRQRISEIDLRGNLSAPDWTISLNERRLVDSLEMLLSAPSSQTFPICPGPESPGKTLTLGAARLVFP